MFEVETFDVDYFSNTLRLTEKIDEYVTFQIVASRNTFLVL